MSKSMIFEGKTKNDAIEKGLKEFHTSKENVEIKVIEEEKRSFFSILEPRVVKIEMTLKDNIEEKDNNIPKENEKEPITPEEIEKITNEVEQFVKELVGQLSKDKIEYSVKYENSFIQIEMNGEDISYLIGYRGEVLNSLQTIISSFISNHTKHRVKAILDIGNYKEKRKITLEKLAERTANNVIKTHRQITLDPMQAYERKIIHTKLQNNNRIKTYSVGEEPHRRLVISPK